MYCAHCGKEIPAGSPTCPACGFNAMGGSPGRGSPHVSFEDALAEVRRAAKDLGRSAERLSRQASTQARKAAKDPTGTARRGARKAAQELQRVADDVERLLRDL